MRLLTRDTHHWICCICSILSHLVAQLISHVDSKPFLHKTTHTQNRTSHRKQLEPFTVFCSPCTSTSWNFISLRFNWRTCGSQNVLPWDEPGSTLHGDSSLHVKQYWDSHCLSPSSSDIDEPNLIKVVTRASSGALSLAFLAFHASLSFALLVWYQYFSQSDFTLSTTRDRQHPSRAYSDPSSMEDLTTSFLPWLLVVFQLPV